MIRIPPETRRGYSWSSSCLVDSYQSVSSRRTSDFGRGARWNRVLDPALHEVKMFSWVSGRVEVDADLLQVSDGLDLLTTQQPRGSAPAMIAVGIGWRAHPLEGVKEIEVAELSGFDSVRATAIMLPPLQTPHSTTGPAIWRRTRY